MGNTETGASPFVVSHDEMTRRAPRPPAVEAPPALRLGSGGRLQLQRGADWIAVEPVRCFPWSQGMRYISLRSANAEELCLIDDPAALDTAARWALGRALRVSGFLLEVTGVVSIEDDFEIRAWKVKTRGGERSFQTELDAWPRPAPGGGHLIEDVAGDVFFIPPLQSLDARSRKQLWPYVE